MIASLVSWPLVAVDSRRGEHATRHYALLHHLKNIYWCTRSLIRIGDGRDGALSEKHDRARMCV